MVPLLPVPPGVPGRLGSLIVPLLPVPPGVPESVVPLPELPVPPVPPVCAKTNVAVIQSTAKVRMSIFVDVRYIIVSFEFSLVMGMMLKRVASPALQVPNATAEHSLIQQFACHRGETQP
jgi:hypothetical protein